MIIFALFAGIIVFASQVLSLEPEVKITSYQPFYEKTVSVIVNNENEKPITGFYISEADPNFHLWSDNQLNNFDNNMVIYTDQTFVLEGVTCGWDMKYDLKAVFWTPDESEEDSEIATRLNIEAPCEKSIWWKVQ